MSAIDSIDHVHVASFFGLPVYWIIENNPMDYVTDMAEDAEKKIGKNDVSIGGGSGEHPALIVNIDMAIYSLLYYVDTDELMSLDLSENDRSLVEEIENFNENIDRSNYSDEWYRDDLNKNQWPLMTFVDVHHGMDNYFSEMMMKSLESRICCAIAMFALSKLPLDDCIKNDRLRSIAKRILHTDTSFLSKELIGAVNMFEVMEKGKCSGKIIKNGKVVWGYSIEEYVSDKS